MKFWKKYSFWTKVKAVIAIFGIGGEATLYINEAGMGWHGVTIASTIIGVIIANFVEDKNNNNIVDAFEK